MNDEKIVLIVSPYGGFEIRVKGASWERQISFSNDLGECLRFAASSLGYPLVLPISGLSTLF